jgi:hypothetical protein
MNLYSYLMSKSKDIYHLTKEAKEAYERFQAHGRTLIPVQDCDPFVFAFVEGGYQAFTFRPDQVVRNREGDLAIVTGWMHSLSRGWLVRIKTANGEHGLCAEDLEPAAFPEGLVEILRGKVHTKVDEAFA